MKQSQWRIPLAGLAALAVCVAFSRAGLAQQPEEEQQQQQEKQEQKQDQQKQDRGQQEPRTERDAARQPDQPAEADERGQPRLDERPQDADQRRQQAQEQDRRPDERGLQDARRGRAELGVIVGQSRGGGVLIREVDPDGPAARAGIRSGDYILAVNGNEVSAPNQVIQLIQDMQPGHEVRLRLWRDGRERTLTASLAERRTAGFRGTAGETAPAEQAWIGVMFHVPPQRGTEEQGGFPERGAQAGAQQKPEIDRVYPSGPAARAGLRSGDVIVQVGERQVETVQDTIEAVERLAPGETTRFIVMRNEERVEVPVTPARRSDFVFQQQQQSRFEQGGFRGETDARGTVRSGAQLQYPEHAMMLEQHRRLAEQHQRIEGLLRELSQRIESLEKEVRGSRGAASQPGRGTQPDRTRPDRGVQPGLERGEQPERERP